MFVAIFESNVIKIFDYNDISNPVDYNNANAITGVKTSIFYSDMLLNSENSISRVRFTNPDINLKTSCHNMCGDLGCTHNFDRHYCQNCGNDYSPTATGCSDLTPSAVNPSTGE
jgi:hypothetical protein